MYDTYVFPTEAVCEFGSGAKRWERSGGARNVGPLTFSGHIY